MTSRSDHDDKPRSALDRVLGLFSDVKAGEAPRVLGMVLSLFVLMLAYYLLKTVREPLILGSSKPEVKSYAAALQAILLIGFVPLYGAITKRVGRRGLILGLVGFFFGCLELFWFAVHVGWKWTGVAFYVWVGIFSLSVLAQFWSFANDVYTEPEGKRLFPIIAIGATVGSPIGARIASFLFDRGHNAALLLQIAAGLLLVHGALTLALVKRDRDGKKAAERDKPIGGKSGGYRLIWKSTYLKAITLLLVLLNTVNSVGEYILSKSVVAHAHQAVSQGRATDIDQYVGAFYGHFFFWVNVIAAIAQLLIVSRMVKYLGVRGVVLFFPVLAMSVYGAVGLGVGFAALRWLKTADNATDYSVQNTANALIWLPTTREEKYRAKQAVDTLFVRLGDVVAAGFVGAAVLLHLAPRMVGLVNVALASGWLAVAFWVAAQNERLSRERGVDPEHAAEKAA